MYIEQDIEIVFEHLTEKIRYLNSWLKLESVQSDEFEMQKTLTQIEVYEELRSYLALKFL